MFSHRFNAFLILAILIHLSIFTLVGVSEAKFGHQREYIQLVQLEEEKLPIAETTEVPTPPEKIIPPKKPDEKKIPLDVVVIPLPDGMPRWIVELIDRVVEEEPDEAHYVNERPSKVEEEVQAEITSRDPKHVPKKRKASKPRPRRTPEEVAADVPKPRRARRPRRPRNTETVAPVAVVTNAETPQPPGMEAPPQGDVQTPPPNPEQPQPPASPSQDNNPKPSPGTKPNLMPSFKDIEHTTGGAPSPGIDSPPNSAPGTEGHADPNTRGEDSTEGEEDVPGVATAPDNVLPLVKKRGGITLLNAKSYKYSTFVRRVAYRMFDRLVAGFHPDDFMSANWGGIQKGGYLVAILNMNGKLVNVHVSRKTGDSRFDSISMNAVEKGAWDSNVPEGAECSDGFVHFVFIPRAIPSNPVDTPQGRVYQNYLIQATAGISECE